MDYFFIWKSLNSWHNSGLTYADEKPNAVFLRCSMDEEKNHWG